MSISIRLKEFLDSRGVGYEHHVHRQAFTAAETARRMHIPRVKLAKTVIVNADGLLRMAVIPANCMLDLAHLKYITRSENIRLAMETEFEGTFPGCEVGAMPVFGSLFGLPVFCDTMLRHNGAIEFNAGTHCDTVRMAFADFQRIENPTIVDLVDHCRQAA